MTHQLLILCMNPHADHAYGILSGDPMAYYLYSLRSGRHVFYSTHQRPLGNLSHEAQIREGYIYNDGMLRWHFQLKTYYTTIQDVYREDQADYIPPYRLGYTYHKRWYLLSQLRQLTSHFSEKISQQHTDKSFKYLTHFQYYVRTHQTYRPLRINNLNAAICSTSLPPPAETDFIKNIDDPTTLVETLLKTDLRKSRLREETIERAFLLKLLIRGTYPTDQGPETVEWLNNQYVLKRAKGRYDLAFKLQDSQRYVAVEFKRGSGYEAIKQLDTYITELQHEEQIPRRDQILPRIVCEQRTPSLVAEAKNILGEHAEVEDYQLSITFTHEQGS